MPPYTQGQLEGWKNHPCPSDECNNYSHKLCRHVVKLAEELDAARKKVKQLELVNDFIPNPPRGLTPGPSQGSRYCANLEAERNLFRSQRDELADRVENMMDEIRELKRERGAIIKAAIKGLELIPPVSTEDIFAEWTFDIGSNQTYKRLSSKNFREGFHQAIGFTPSGQRTIDTSHCTCCDGECCNPNCNECNYGGAYG